MHRSPRLAVTSLLSLSLVATLAPAATGQASQHADDDLAAALDAVVAEFLEGRRVPGMAVGVVRDGSVIFAKGYGVADPESGRAVTARSLFHVASVSKTFVAAAVMQLVERGDVDLDTPVAKYLPYFRLADDRAGEITVRQMLSHTSGLPDVVDYAWDDPEVDDGALERYVRGLADRELRFGPGEGWSYSNMAYEVLGDLIAKVSGRPFETYMREAVLEPVGMARSTFLLEQVDPELRTVPHIGRGEPAVSNLYPYNRAHAPSSTQHSSAEEMCRWILVHAGRGELGGVRLLEESSVAELWKPLAHPRPDRGVGLAWFLADTAHGPRAFLGGRDVGFRSHVSVLPERGGGVVILGNHSELDIRTLRGALEEVAFGSGN
jgi:CubicO group peptidase (beta-lactamase class C family)